MDRDTQMALLITRKKQLILALLDQFCQQLDITDSQYETAKSRYESVGTWLSESTSAYLDQVQIYPQGSIALGTAIKPLSDNEFDVDLVCYLPTLLETSGARAVKDLIGARLKEHGTYRSMLEEKQRCWRINYANEFHLDITPSIINRRCINGGELVPDKALVEWKPTNPRGYIQKFERYASVTPRFYQTLTKFTEARGDVAPLPDNTMSKPFLKRIVQLLKRHRDNMFCGTGRADVAPISVIITTLAAWAYARCAARQAYADAFEFIVAVINEMPTFIRTEIRQGQEYYVIENETTEGENFADKWNKDPRLPVAFYEWHSSVATSIQVLLQIEGADQFAESLAKNFGAKKEHVCEALARVTSPISQARAAGALVVAPALGLSTAYAPGSVAVPKNTFFGQ